MEIKDHILNIDMSKYRVFKETSLFPPDFGQLKQNKCPLCFHKIYWNRKGTMGFCRSKRKDKFSISKAKFDSINKTVA